MKFVKVIRENLKDPKKKSLTLLGLYAIFFIFVFVLLNSSNGSNNNIKPSEPSDLSTNSTKDNYKNMSSYQYNINFIGSNFISTIYGTYYLNTSLFTYNNNKYFYENDLLYLIDGTSYYLADIEYNIKKLFSNKLFSILDKLQEESVTTYNDGRIRTNYIMNSNDFCKFYFEVDTNYDTNISIEIVEFNNYITNISIDLTNLFLNISKIDIEYSNINNISNLEFNKSNYVYRE